MRVVKAGRQQLQRGVDPTGETGKEAQPIRPRTKSWRKIRLVAFNRSAFSTV